MNLTLWVGLAVITGWPWPSSVRVVPVKWFCPIVLGTGLLVGIVFIWLVWPRAAWFRAAAAVENEEEAKRWCEY